MGDKARRYREPTIDEVEGALSVGVRDPSVLLEDHWSPEQKRVWQANFKTLAGLLDHRARAADKEARNVHQRAGGFAQAAPPIARDLAAGVGMGAIGDLGSLALRQTDMAGVTHGLADTMNREVGKFENVARAAGASDPVPEFVQGVVRGAGRSLGTMLPVAAVTRDPRAVIGAFALSRGNQAATEADDAGLKGLAKAEYVGKAALIEGAVATVFQAVPGLGGAESAAAAIFKGGAGARTTAKKILAGLRGTAAEVTEENITEFLDAHNQAVSNVADPLSFDQGVDMFLKTTAQTVLTMGLLEGVNATKSKAGQGSIDALAEEFGWTSAEVQAFKDLAGEGDTDDTRAALERAVGRKVSVAPGALKAWADSNEEIARGLAQVEDPSRSAFKAAEAAGLPRSNSKEERAHIRDMLQVYYDDAGLEAADLDTLDQAGVDTSGVAAQVQSRGGLKARQEEVRGQRKLARSVVQIQREEGVGFAEAVKIHESELSPGEIADPLTKVRKVTGKTDQGAAPDDPGLSQSYQEAITPPGLPPAAPAAVTEALAPADWREASLDELSALIEAGAIPPAETQEALDRQATLLVEYVQQDEGIQRQLPVDLSVTFPEGSDQRVDLSKGLKPKPATEAKPEAGLPIKVTPKSKGLKQESKPAAKPLTAEELRARVEKRMGTDAVDPASRSLALAEKAKAQAKPPSPLDFRADLFHAQRDFAGGSKGKLRALLPAAKKAGDQDLVSALEGALGGQPSPKSAKKLREAIEAFKSRQDAGAKTEPAPEKPAGKGKGLKQKAKPAEGTEEKPEEKPAAKKKRTVKDRLRNLTPEKRAKLEELKKRLKAKAGLVRTGVDLSFFADGAQAAAIYLEADVRNFAEFARDMIEDGFGTKHLRAWWNGGVDVSGAPEDLEVSREDAAAIIAGIEAEGVTEEAAPAESTKAERTISLAREIGSRIEAGDTLTWRELTEMATAAYGGTHAEHAFSMTDAWEAQELGVNLVVGASTAVGTDRAKSKVEELEGVLARLATQTTKDDQKDDLQQFSTPPHYAFAANWVASPRKGDVVLEPSAGTGSLATHAKASGAKVIGNERDPRRADLLKEIADEVFEEDALQIHNILAPDLSGENAPSLVIMNPPFSANANLKGIKKIKTGAKHIESALKLLRPGGRLVAIVGGGRDLGPGGGMGPASKTFATWWDKIGGEFDVRANVGVSGKVYSKYGTSFNTRLLVIDKNPPRDVAGTVTGEVNTIEELVEKLEGVRNERSAEAADQPAVGDDASKPGGKKGGGVAPGGVTSPPSGKRGGGRATEPAHGAEGVREGGSEPNAGRRGGKVPPGRGGKKPKGKARGAEGDPSGAAPPRNAEERAGVSELVTVEAAEPRVMVELDEDASFEPYVESLKIAKSMPHPTPLVESAAMASVKPPKAIHPITIDRRLLEDTPEAAAWRKERGLGGEEGIPVLSGAQLEAMVYAGHMHGQQMRMSLAQQNEYRDLTGEEPPEKVRRGFFIGDGTGVGKGRESAGIILDNWNNGRRRAIWISERMELMDDARRDWKDLGREKAEIVPLGDTKVGEQITHGDGVVFSTYSTIGTSAHKDGDTKTRVEQLVDWFGADYDGVVILDESHNAANSLSIKGKRGRSKAAAQALMTIELQRRLPNARFVYVSATGATEVANLAYAERLGLWGEGTAFPTREAFVTSVSAGGVAAMELVARDMKAQGMYVSRTLSFDGVGYERLTHDPTPDQKESYNTLADAWQTVLRDIDAALELTGTDGKVDGKQKSKAYAQFWGAHQRFFNQILTSMQMPTVLKRMQADLDAGHSPVIQLSQTYASAVEDALDKLAAEDGDLQRLDITPTATLFQMIENHFPTQQMEEYTDSNGNVRQRGVTRRVPDLKKDGTQKRTKKGALKFKDIPVENAAAVRAREALLDRLADIRIPDSPIDQILNKFGADAVAEITGRKRRVVMGPNGLRVIQASRTNVVRKKEVADFMAGRRKILIFSKKGMTGASYHASIKAANQSLRRHYVLQAGWQADKAIQGLGRTHRSHQSQPPEFVLVETSLPGHRRFISTIARRLEQLGALSRGQRTAGGGGLFSESDNLEGSHAEGALQQLVRDVLAGEVDGVTKDEMESQSGIELQTEEGVTNKIDIKQFLNRLLSMKPDFQHSVFDAFSERLAAHIEFARQNGTLDVGMETIRATKIEKVSEQVVRVDKRSGAETKYVKLKVFNPSRKISWEAAHKDQKGEPLYMRQKRSGRSYVLFQAANRTDENGRIIETYHRWGPNSDAVISGPELAKNYLKATEANTQAEWNERLANTPELKEKTQHLITGTLLPIWNRLKGHATIKRATTTDGERFLGRVVDQRHLSAVLGGLGVEEKTETPTAKEAQEILLGGGVIQLEGGYTLRSVRRRDETSFEVDGVTSSMAGGLLVEMGARKDRDGSRNRYFAPKGDGFAKFYERITDSYEVSRVIQGTDDDLMFMPSGTSSSSAGRRQNKGAKRSIQRVEIINTIKRLWPKLSVRGKATFNRQFNLKRALGWYSADLGEMRMRDAYDVTTALHELGHHYSREMEKWGWGHRGLPKAIKDELADLGKALYGNRKPSGGYREEGFAEYMREFLTRGNIQARAPNLHAWFTTQFLPANPTSAKKLLELADEVLILQTQSHAQEREAFTRETVEGFDAGRMLQRAIATLEKEFVDAGLPILRGMQSTGADLTKIPPRDHVYMLMTYYARTAGGRARNAALHNTVDLHGRANGKGLRDILLPIIQQGGHHLDDFKEYIVARRALNRYHRRGLNPGLSREAAEDAVKKFGGRQGYKQAADEFADFAHRAMHVLVEAGAMTQAEFDVIVAENPMYVPFLRRMEGEAGGSSSKKGVHGIKKGGNQPIHDPIDAMLQQYERIQKVAMQHDVLRALAKFYDTQKGNPQAAALGQFMSEIPIPQNAVVFGADKVKDYIEGVAEKAGLTEAETDQAIEDYWQDQLHVYGKGTGHSSGGNLTVFVNGKEYKGALSVVIDGKRRLFQLKPDILPALEGVAESTFLSGRGGKFIRAVTALQRLGATGLNPEFGLISNPMRDTATAAIVGDYHWHVPVFSTLAGSVMDIMNSDYARAYRAAGLQNAGRIGQDMHEAHRLGTQVVSRVPPGGPVLEALRRIEGASREAAAAGKALTQGQIKAAAIGAFESLRFGVDGLRDVLSHSEIGPRLMEFSAAIKHGEKKWGKGSPDALILAGAASKDVTVNFSRAGKTGRKLNEAILFINANLQSSDKVLRAMGIRDAMPWAKHQSRAKNFARTSARGLSYLTSVALLAYFKFRDEEWWQKLPPWEKWGFMHWKVGKTVVRIPLPFEAGAAFGALPVALLEESRSPGALKEALGVASKTLLPLDLHGLHGLSRNLAIYAPVADVLHNKDWKGAPIVPSNVEENRVASDQFGPRTSGLARRIGAHFPGEEGYSPAVIEHLMNSYTGNLYRRLDRAVVAATDPSNIRPGEDLSTLPLLGILFLRPGTSRVVSEFYDRRAYLKRRAGSSLATLSEKGELARANRVNKTLTPVWARRRAAIVSGKTQGDIQREALAFLKEAQAIIDAHDKRDAGQDRRAGLGAALYKGTGKSGNLKVPEGVREEEALKALETEVLRRADAAARRKGLKKADRRKALNPRLPSGRLSSYGERKVKLIKAFR